MCVWKKCFLCSPLRTVIFWSSKYHFFFWLNIYFSKHRTSLTNIPFAKKYISKKLKERERERFSLKILEIRNLVFTFALDYFRQAAFTLFYNFRFFLILSCIKVKLLLFSNEESSFMAACWKLDSLFHKKKTINPGLI